MGIMCLLMEAGQALWMREKKDHLDVTFDADSSESVYGLYQYYESWSVIFIFVVELVCSALLRVKNRHSTPLLML